MKSAKRVITIFFIAILLCTYFPCSIIATTEITDVPGKVYDFDKDNAYLFSASAAFSETNAENTYGTFSISGTIENTDIKDGVPSYEVADTNLSFYYNYTDTILNADIDSWHLIDDKSKEIDNLKLDSKIMKGVIIVQTSKDRLNWLNAHVITNAFAETPIRTEAIYNSQDIQLINGCFYRVIIAYKLRIRTEDSNFLFVNTDKFDYKKCLEVYELYAHAYNSTPDTDNQADPYELGELVRVADSENYSGSQTIDVNDPHSGWNLGQFSISGHTSDRMHETEGQIILKNVDDKVTLWFRLNENINCLHGNKDLFVSADTDGYDVSFKQGPMNFEKGALFIKHTDRNKQTKITTYTNFLEANASVNADTKVYLFEEGDYEVALDYKITHDQLIDKHYYYRISFKFAVRNSNCIVFPIDLETGSELTNSSITENGFRLDLANSKYLDINLKREILVDSADGVIEDTRFNGAARDGSEYTEEGIYTITVNNRYTKETTVKKIYVGKNNILKAYLTTGLSIPELNSLVAGGATISDAGVITLADSPLPTFSPSESDTIPTKPIQTSPSSALTIVLIIIGVVIIVVAGILIYRKKIYNHSRQRKGGEK